MDATCDKSGLAILSWAAMVLAGLGSNGCATPSPSLDGANIVLVTLDTLRADHLGCYGYSRATSPVIDSLARGAIVFESAVSPSAITPVAHASILTGRDPYHHGLRSLHGGDDDILVGAEETLAETLGRQGYDTAAFVSAFPASLHYGLDQGFETWDQEFESSDGSGLTTARGIVNTGRAQRRGDLTTDRALSWLEGRGARDKLKSLGYLE